MVVKNAKEGYFLSISNENGDITICVNHWQIQGGRHGTCSPQQDQFLSFSHTFLLKSVCVGGWHPPQWVGAPPMGNPGSATVNISEIRVLPASEFLIFGMYGCKGRPYKKKIKIPKTLK